jgi:hypothetical protein
MSRFGSRTRVSTYLSDWMPTNDTVESYTYHVFTSSGTLTVTSGGTNTFAGGSGGGTGTPTTRGGGGGGGASEVGANGGADIGGNGGEGLTAVSFDARLTAGNFSGTLTSQGTWSSGGGGGCFNGGANTGEGGTGAGNGTTTITGGDATMYGAGGGGMGSSVAGTDRGGNGFQGLVIVRYLTGTAAASGGQETVTVAV